MSNKNCGGFLGLFKKPPKRESNQPDDDVRMSREFGTLDYMSLVPNEESMETQPDLESKPQQEDKSELQRVQRKEQMETQRAARERQRKKAREQQINMQRQRNLSAERRKKQAALRPRSLAAQRPNILEPSPSLVCSKNSGRASDSCLGTEEEFKRDIENLEQQIGDLDFRSKMMATLWMNRLRAPVQSKEEAIARNIITAHLLKCQKENIFNKEPFNQPPTSDNLETVREKILLTSDTPCNDMILENQRETNFHLNKLFRDSYDGGEFLSQLPVPRDGTFFILHMRPNLECNQI